MTFFTQDEPKNLVESVSNIMAERVAGSNLPKMVREAAIEAGKAAAGKSLEERSQILHHYFNSSTIEAQVADAAFRPTNDTVRGFNEVAENATNQYEAAESAGSFEDVADDPGSPLSAEDRARLNKRKVKEEAESAGSFEDVAKSKGSPLQADAVAQLNKRKTNEGAESAGSFEDVADDEGSPLSAEDRARLNKRKVKEQLRLAAADFLENLANFGDKKKKFPDDKDGDGKVDEAKGKFPDFLKKKGEDEDEDEDSKVDEATLERAQEYLDTWNEEITDEVLDAALKMAEEDTSGTDKPVEDEEQDERRVSVKAKTVRDIDDVPVSKTHSFVNESWTILVNTESLSVGEQHLLAGRLVEEDDITEATACCPTNRQPFTATVNGETEIEAIENFVSALENVGSTLGAEEVLVAHRTPVAEASKGRSLRSLRRQDDEMKPRDPKEKLVRSTRSLRSLRRQDAEMKPK